MEYPVSPKANKNIPTDSLQVVRFFSSLPIKSPGSLQKFLYALTPVFLRKQFKKQNRLKDLHYLRAIEAFDELYYLSQFTPQDLPSPAIDLLEHYIDIGELQGKNPSALLTVNTHTIKEFRDNNFRNCYYAAFLQARGLSSKNIEETRENLRELNRQQKIKEDQKQKELQSQKEAEQEELKNNRLTIAKIFALVGSSKIKPEPEAGAGVAVGRTQVLFICHEASKTGAPIVLRELIKNLCAQAPDNTHANIQPWIVCDAAGALYQEFADIAPTLIAPDIQNLLKESREAFIEELATWFTKLAGPKIALCNSISSRDYAEAFSHHKIPVIAWLHELSTSIELYSGGEKTMKKLQDEAAQVVLVSQMVRQANIERFHLKPDFGKVIKYGLALKEPQDQSDQSNDNEQFRQKILNELKIPQNAPLVLGCGTIDKRKGVDLFIQAAKTISTLFEKDFPNQGINREKPHFIWAGEIRDHDFCWWCKHDAALLGLGEQLHFVGVRDDLPDFYKNSTVFLMTSREDPFPLVSMEALGYGLPVVAFAGATGQEELLSHGGVLVPYLNSQEMAKAAYRLLADKQARAELSQEASAYIKANYTWANCAEEFLGEIKRLSTVAK